MGLGTGSANEQGKGAVFYRFQDATGRVHIVDSLDLVPMAQRGRAERISYDEQTSVNGLLATHAPSGWQTFALGVGAALLVAFLFRRLPSTFRLVLRLAIVAGVVALLGGAYFGWARRTARQSSDVLATPGALIDDAKAAVDKMNARMKVQQAELKEAAETK